MKVSRPGFQPSFYLPAYTNCVQSGGVPDYGNQFYSRFGGPHPCPSWCRDCCRFIHTMSLARHVCPPPDAKMPRNMVGSLLLRVFAVLLLVAVNGFFVAAEFALVQLRPARVHQLIEAGRTGARIALRLHEHLDSVLAAVQLGITLANLALGFIGEPFIASIFQGWLGHTPLGATASHAIAIALSFILITYLTVILGEILPKALALQRGERVALAVAGPMEFFIAVAGP